MLTIFGSGSIRITIWVRGVSQIPPPSILKTKRHRIILKISTESYRHYLHKKIIFEIRQKMTSQWCITLSLRNTLRQGAHGGHYCISTTISRRTKKGVSTWRYTNSEDINRKKNEIDWKMTSQVHKMYDVIKLILRNNLWPHNYQTKCQKTMKVISSQSYSHLQ